MTWDVQQLCLKIKGDRTFLQENGEKGPRKRVEGVGTQRIETERMRLEVSGQRGSINRTLEGVDECVINGVKSLRGLSVVG